MMLGDGDGSQKDARGPTERALPAEFAAVWLVMRGSAYAPGAAVSAWTWREAGSRALLVCMVTPDVDEHARRALRGVFDVVEEVQYMQHARCVALASAKKRRMYDAWKSVGFTKWRCLGLAHLARVVLFMDADTVLGPLRAADRRRDVDELFSLPAPAGTFSSPWHAPWNRRAPCANPFASLRHGDPVPEPLLRKGYDTSFLIGTTVLLPTWRGADAEMQRWLARHETFGWRRCGSMLDEQAVCAFFHQTRPQMRWTMIGPAFNSIPWHAHTWPGATPQRVLHFFNSNPWEARDPAALWDDMEPWFEAARRAVQSTSRGDSKFHWWEFGQRARSLRDCLATWDARPGRQRESANCYRALRSVAHAGESV